MKIRCAIVLLLLTPAMEALGQNELRLARPNSRLARLAISNQQLKPDSTLLPDSNKVHTDTLLIDTLFNHHSSIIDHQARLIWPEYPAFQDFANDDSVFPGALNVRMKSASFFKNNEFKNSFIYGQSLIGIYFEPVLEYHPDVKTTIRAGVHLLKYHGRDGFDRKLPVISIRYDATEHFSMIFGTLCGTTNHGLIEPLQNFENYLINNYENGIQFLWNYPGFRSDVWLNWEQFIKVDDPFPEIFTAASNSEFRLLDWNGLSLTAPLSTVFQHTGGEIDSYWVPGGTKLNLVHGLRLNWSMKKGFVKNLYAVQNFVEFIEINPGGHITIPYGHGNYARAGIDTKIGSFEAGYWTATDFFSPHGMPLFLSTSIKDPLFYQADRKMLVLKYQFQRDLTDFLRFAVRIEPYYHFDTGRMDHSWSIYLVMDEGFFITRLKRKGE